MNTASIQNTSTNTAVYSFDARGIAKRFRHAAIFGALESLNEGETMRFVNDHDPLPLLKQISDRYSNQVGMVYVVREPSNIVIDFTVQDPDCDSTAPAALATSLTPGGGCGGGGCGCSGAR